MFRGLTILGTSRHRDLLRNDVKGKSALALSPDLDVQIQDGLRNATGRTHLWQIRL